MKTLGRTGLVDELRGAARSLARLEGLVATVKGRDRGDARFAAALEVGGMAAIHHGYERFTKDIDIVVGKGHLDPLIRVAPDYGIRIVWHDPNGWHKLRYKGVDIEIVPEGGQPRKNAPT